MITKTLQHSACNCLSKSGGFSAVRVRLEASAQVMTKAQLRELYCFFRDNAMRWESEWRPEFLSIFGISDGDLPVVDDAERWGSILHHLVVNGDLQKVRAFVEGIGVSRWDFSPRAKEPAIDVYPLDALDGNGETPVGKARRLGHAEVALFLENVRYRIFDRYTKRWQDVYGSRDGGKSRG